MAIDISDLLDKKENDGSSPAGKLSAKEWNTLVQAVQENQDVLENTVFIRGINYNGTPYTNVVDGMLEMKVGDGSGRSTEIFATKYPDPTDGSHYITPSDSCIVEFIVKDYEIKDGNEIPFKEAGEIKYYINKELVYTQTNVFAFESQNYTGPISFDFSKYGKLTTSTSGNELKIEYTNNGVMKSDVYYVWMLDIKLAISNVEPIYTTNSLQDIKYTFSGYQNYLIYAKIDNEFVLEGKECDTAIDEYLSGTDAAVSKCNTHGVHTLYIWAEVPIPNSEFRLATPVQEFTYIFGDIYNSTPVVMSNLLSNSEFELYNNLTISYYVYLSNANTTKKLNIKLISENGKIIDETNQDIQFTDDKYNGSHSFSLFPNDNSTENDIIGNVKVSLSVDGSAPFEVPIIVKESTIPLTQEKNYYAYFTAQGRNNNEDKSTLRVWESKHHKYPSNPTITTVTFDDSIDFTQNGSGWNTDEEGNTAMHLRRGNYFTVNYQPFKINPVYKNDNRGEGQGLTISIEFATRNCLNANAKVIECMDNGVGFYVTAGEAFLKSATTNLRTAFKEDTRIKLDIVIEDELRTYNYVSAVGTGGVLANYTNDQSYAIIFVDGVYSGVSLIQPTTTFKQDNPQFIKFGSEDCDLDIYNIRIYEKTLNIKNIVDNYAYDTPNISEKIKIAKRNLGILSENSSYPFLPNINIERTRLSNGVDGGLKVARPDLPIFYVTLTQENNADILPNTKNGDGVEAFTQFVNPLHNSPMTNTEAMCSFEVPVAGFKNQGTSSMNYPWPWRNFDWKILKDSTGQKLYYIPKVGSNITSEKWYQFPYKLKLLNSKLGIKKITLKKDYASSEMCNNAITSEYFTDMALGIYKDYIDESTNSSTKHTYNPGVLSPAMYDDININNHTDLRLALKSLPCFCVQKLNPDFMDPSILPNTSDNNFAIGMMNLIPNKNEVGYLGFKKNKWEDAKDGVTEREQSWELKENYEHIYWVTPFEYLHKDEATGKYISDLDGKYEARTPKDTTVFDDGDFGMLKNHGNNLSAEEYSKLYDEQKDIIDFHNWACSVDRGNATNKPLTEIHGPFYQPEEWNVNPDTGAPYETDSAEYRFAKFKGEAEKYLLIDQWILYYLWREQFWMYDSGFKNLQVYTIGPNPKYPESGIMQWGCMVRDADTALGIQNVGEIVFPPHLEDIDYGVQSGNKEDGAWTFYYNDAKDIYSVNQLHERYGTNAKSVLNGQFGSLWLNIRDAYGDKIMKMYNLLTSSKSFNFNSNAVIKKFRDHQENWSESLYNFGLRQYIGGELFTNNLKAACGDKKHSRAQWLERAFFYRASKYKSLGDDKFSMRAATYEAPADEEALRGDSIKVKTYIPMYIGMGGAGSDNDGVATHLRIVEQDEDGNYCRNIPVGDGTHDNPGFRYSSSADTNNYIFGISMITDFDDLARYIKLSNIQDLKYAPKLRKLQFGHEPLRDGVTYHEMVTETIDGENVKVKKVLSNSFANQVLSFNPCPQLELLDLTNHIMLPGISIDKCLQLKELYLRGTDNLTSLTLPKTNLLKKLYLNDKLTALDLSDLSGLKEIVIDGLSNCTQLTIRNSGEYVSKKEISYNFMSSVINNHGLNRLILEGIDWDLSNESNAINNLEKILELRSKYGKEYVSLKGKITGLNGLTGDMKIKLCDPVNGFGDIDDPNNDLYIQYRQNPIKVVSLPNKLYLHEKGKTYDMKDNLIMTDANGNSLNTNTYKGSKWSIEPANNEYITCTEDGIITRLNADADEYSPSVRLTVTVYQMDTEFGEKREELTASCTLYFYERIAKPGDIVFNDGSYGDEKVAGKTPIGICFYVDPEDNTRRLMCSTELLSNAYAFGVDAGTVITNSDNTFREYYGTSPNMSIPYSNYDVYDIAAIRNITEYGAGVDPSMTIPYANFTDDIYRDSTNEDNSYFKNFNKFTTFGDLGWNFATNDITVDYKDLDGNTYVKRISAGEELPSGYYKTLAIIEHRNKVLDAYKNTLDQNGAFVRPADVNKYEDELTNLNNLIAQADTWKYADWTENANTFGSALYYPAASACFAFEPNANNLADKFKRRNWFLPASGDVMRILYYLYHSYDGTNYREEPVDSMYTSTHSSPANAFKMAIKERIFNTSGVRSYLQSSTEQSRNDATIGTFDAITINTRKHMPQRVLPICAF